MHRNFIDGKLLRRAFIHHLLNRGLVAGFTMSMSGCGTLLHKERINRPHANELDWKVVALDGLGLILFFIPGVIAFVVDFHTGAIYLPAEPYAMKPSLQPNQAVGESATFDGAEQVPERGDFDRVVLKKIAVDSGELNLAIIEREVTNHVGTPISLSDNTSRVTELKNLGEFTAARQRHEADHTFGISLKHFFQRIMGSRVPDLNE